MTDQSKIQQQESMQPQTNTPMDPTDEDQHPQAADHAEPPSEAVAAAPSVPHTPANKQDAPQDDFTWGQGLDVDVTHDHMAARLTIVVDQADHYSIEQIVNYLSENRVVYGVNEDAIRRIFKEKLFNQKIKVAEGRPPQHGDDGYVDWKIDISILDGAELVERGGRVDWKERHFVLEVNKDDLLANLVDPTPGTPGINVHGEEIEAKVGKEVRLPAGKNVVVSSDGKSMHAAIKGVVSREGERISISPTYVVQGDVNYATGNIQFDESIIVSGGVLSEFKVQAGQDLHVNGLVEGAELSAGGSIFINAGIQGGDKAVLRAGGDINAKFVNGATLVAHGDIIINGPVTQSSLRAGGAIRLVGDKGIAIGGVLSAEKEISAQVIGSESEVKTYLEVGKDLSKIATLRREEEKKIHSLHENYNKLRQAVAAMDKVKEKGGKLSEQQEALRLKIIRTGLQVQAQIKKTQESIEHLVKQFTEARREIRGVIARGMVWPGAHIDILKRTYIVKTQSSKCQFVITPKDEIEMYAFVEQDAKEKKKDNKAAASGS